MTHKSRKKYRIFMFCSAGCSLLRAEGFSCSLGVLYGGLRISKLQFLIKKIKNLISSCTFFFKFSSWNPGSGSAIRKSAGSGSGSNADPQPCLELTDQGGVKDDHSLAAAVPAALIKKKIKLSSYIYKEIQKWSSCKVIYMTTGLLIYMVKYLRISSYIRKPYLIYDVATEFPYIW